VANSGKNPHFTNHELELLGTIISKISCRLTHLITVYPPQKLIKVTLTAYKSRRTKTIIHVLQAFLSDSQLRDDAIANKIDWSEFIRGISIQEDFNSTDMPTHGWVENHKDSISSKETSIIKRMLRDRGTLENIFGKNNIDRNRRKKIGGRPSDDILSEEAKNIILLLSRKDGREFIINSLLKSQLLGLVYWYIFTYLLYLIRDIDISKINQLIDFDSKSIKEDQKSAFLQSIPEWKSLLIRYSDSEIVLMAQKLSANLIGSIRVLNDYLLITSLLKLNRHFKLIPE